jgi:hypothetical protein
MLQKLQAAQQAPPCCQLTHLPLGVTPLFGRDEVRRPRHHDNTNIKMPLFPSTMQRKRSGGVEVQPQAFLITALERIELLASLSVRLCSGEEFLVLGSRVGTRTVLDEVMKTKISSLMPEIEPRPLSLY